MWIICNEKDKDGWKKCINQAHQGWKKCLQKLKNGRKNVERILTNINIEPHVEVTPGNTLIIFDEIQEAPRALESLKYFCENASEYAVIAAGSLLGVAIHSGISFPVGKVDSLELHPMNFREFYSAAIS